MTSIKRHLIHTFFSVTWFTFHTWPLQLPMLPHSYPLDKSPISSCVSLSKGLILDEPHCPALISLVSHVSLPAHGLWTCLQVTAGVKLKGKRLHLLVNFYSNKQTEWDIVLQMLFQVYHFDFVRGLNDEKIYSRNMRQLSSSWLCMQIQFYEYPTFIQQTTGYLLDLLTPSGWNKHVQI